MKPARWWVARTKLVSTTYRPGLAERSGLELAVPFCQYTDRKSRLVDVTVEAGRQRLAILPDFLQQAAVRYRGSRRHGPAQRRVDHCQHRRVAIGLLRTAGGLREPYPHASPRRRSIFSISATCISSLRIFSRANSSREANADFLVLAFTLVDAQAHLFHFLPQMLNLAGSALRLYKGCSMVPPSNASLKLKCSCTDGGKEILALVMQHKVPDA